MQSIFDIYREYTCMKDDSNNNRFQDMSNNEEISSSEIIRSVIQYNIKANDEFNEDKPVEPTCC